MLAYFSLPSQFLYALLLHLLLWQMPVDGSHKRCTSTQVVSHTKNLPFDHGTMVTPSEHFPSALYKPDDSRLLGMFAKANEQ